MRAEIALKCMKCGDIFDYCVNGVKLGKENLPQVYNFVYSVCPKCTDKLCKQYSQIRCTKCGKIMNKKNATTFNCECGYISFVPLPNRR